MERIEIGIIGCGNISHSYLKGAARSEMVRVRSVADLNTTAAQERSAEYGESSTEGRHVMIETSCERPEPVPLGNGEEVFYVHNLH